MVPKTERFEMRLDPRTFELIDEWAEKHSEASSRADAIRQLIEAGLAADAGRDRLNPSRSEKLIIWLLTELLKQQKNYQEQDTIKLIQQALYGGHFWALEWEMTGVFEPKNDTPQQVDFVARTMTMWRMIEQAAAKWNDKDRDRVEAETGKWNRDPRFDGFDGNNEGAYFGIAQFLVQDMGRFEEFKGRSLNSHSSRVSKYREMLTVYDRIEWNMTRGGLTVDEVIKILKRG